MVLKLSTSNVWRSYVCIHRDRSCCVNTWLKTKNKIVNQWIMQWKDS